MDFHPQVSAILNITPDHLNRHHTMECYIETKESITKNQTKDEVCVLNYEDEVLLEFGKTLPIRVVYFSSKRRLEDGFFYEDGVIYKSTGGKAEKIIETSRLQILGLHNYENVMAAAAMADSFGVPMEVIRKVLEQFRAVEHRIEYVVEKRGVKFYNDSKGTNPDAAIQGIRAMERPRKDCRLCKKTWFYGNCFCRQLRRGNGHLLSECGRRGCDLTVSGVCKLGNV